MIPQELRAEFEATFANIAVRYNEILSASKTGPQKPRLPTDASITELLSVTLEMFDAGKVVNYERSAPYTSVHTRADELVQVATHILALFDEENEHACAITEECYTKTGTTEAFEHAQELFGTQRFERLRTMLKTSPKLCGLFGKNSNLKANMESILAAFPDHAPVKPSLAAAQDDEALLADMLQNPPSEELEDFVVTLHAMASHYEPMAEMGQIAFDALAIWRTSGNEQKCREFLRCQFTPQKGELGMSLDLFMSLRQYPQVREIFRGQADDLEIKLRLMVTKGLGQSRLTCLPTPRPQLKLV